ncbi:hypothetical protein DH09_08135 [Bacillaceae bacterium JMAK1]|nr:hypothetical protein DH09_08135 [Bacillaceae bacterium JMAK1]
MTNFYDVLEEDLSIGVEGFSLHPYARNVKNDDDFEEDWIAGHISIDWLNQYFGDLEKVDEMIDRAESFGEGTVLYFEWLKNQSLIN